MNGVFCAFTHQRTDGVFGLVQTEHVRAHVFHVVAIARNELQRQFHRFITVTAHAFHRQEFCNDHVTVKLRHFLALDAAQNHTAFFACQLNGADHGGRATRGTVNDQVGHQTTRDLGHRLQQVFVANGHGVAGTQVLGHGQTFFV